jgi:hypothetical protein
MKYLLLFLLQINEYNNQKYCYLSSSLLSSQKELVAATAVFDRKIEVATEGLQPYISNYFKVLGITNSTILADYIIAARSESTISDSYRKETIKGLSSCYPNFSTMKSCLRKLLGMIFSHTLTVYENLNL